MSFHSHSSSLVKRRLKANSTDPKDIPKYNDAENGNEDTIQLRLGFSKIIAAVKNIKFPLLSVFIGDNILPCTVAYRL